MSRKRTNRADRIIDRPKHRAQVARTITGKKHQVQCGRTPEAMAKIITTMRLRSRLKVAVSTTEAGITRRGKRIFRTRFSRSNTARTEAVVAAPENLYSQESKIQTDEKI